MEVTIWRRSNAIAAVAALAIGTGYGFSCAMDEPQKLPPKLQCVCEGDSQPQPKNADANRLPNRRQITINGQTIELPEGAIAIVIDGQFLASTPHLDEGQTTAPAEPRKWTIDLAETKADLELGALQKKYRELRTNGKWDEAHQIARWVLADDIPSIARPSPQDSGDEGVVAAVPREPKPFPLHHQVGFRSLKPNMGGDAARFPATGEPLDWKFASVQIMSFHFRANTLAEVARHFQVVSGMTVRVELNNSYPMIEELKVSASCRNKTLAQALQIALAPCGLGYYVRQGELVIAPPPAIEMAVRTGGVDATWFPR